MTQSKMKIFKDSVHGYINVPICYIKHLIDTDFFQRLRNIEQTGMKVLYPSAKHDRFSHSMGVFHLGQKALEALRKGKYFEEDFARYEIIFLTACILHDIGHTPFSHSLEDQIFEKSSIIFHQKGKRAKSDTTRKIDEQLISLINEYEAEFCSQNQIQQKSIEAIKAAPHEMLGSYLIFDQFQSNIKNLEVDCQIFENDDVFHDDLCFIVRMIMGIKYGEFSQQRQVRNCFIELLNGDNFDVDKLDYIVRDTQMSGISNVSVDVERLLGSLCVVTKTKHLEKELVKADIDNLTISKLANNDSGSFEIEGQFKGVIKVFKGAEVEIKRGSYIELFKGVNHDSAEVSYLTNDQAIFSASTNLKQDSEWVQEEESERHKDKGKVKLLSGVPNHRTFGLYFEKGELIEALKIKARGDLEIHVIGHCELKIKGKFEAIGSLKLFHLTQFNGTISEVEILGNTFEQNFTSIKEPSEHGYNTYSIGFRKQAINVIANVLEARNYLYLWVYAHHKVIYYANFLIPVIAKKISQYCGADGHEGFPSWELCYDNLKELDDYYLWTAIKYIYCEQKTFDVKKPYTDLIEQLFSRVYNKSLYKSLAEFELVFDSLTVDQRLEALKKLRAKTDAYKPFLGEKKTYVAGYLNAKTVGEINNIINNLATSNGLQKFSLNEILYVVTEFKQKSLDPDSVYLDMVDEILPISQMRLLSSNKLGTQKIKDQYFYIYYKSEREIPAVEVKIIKEAIKDYLSPKGDKKQNTLVNNL